VKRLILFVALVLLLLPCAAVQAQILNAGFESWTNGNPDNWFTNNAPPAYTTVTQSSDAHSGTSALMGATVNFSSVILAPTVAAGTGDQGFSISTRSSSITGYYKFTPVGGDSLYISAVMYNASVGIGAGFIAIGANVSTYTQFILPIIYATGDTPNKLTLQFSLKPGGTTYHAGTTFLIDDISLGNATSVSEAASPLPTVFNLAQNYPNPFNPSTNIQFTVPAEGRATLKVFNMLGQEVATLFNDNAEAGIYHQVEFNASNLASGIYFSQLEFGGKMQMKKMLLLK
jgi:Secretion system C-terminal sorting domain